MIIVIIIRILVYKSINITFFTSFNLQISPFKKPHNGL